MLMDEWIKQCKYARYQASAVEEDSKQLSEKAESLDLRWRMMDQKTMDRKKMYRNHRRQTNLYN